MGPPIFELHRVSMSFGTDSRLAAVFRFVRKVFGMRSRRTTVFRRVNAVCPTDRGLVGIAGPSGSGKTTLLKLLSGQIVPQAGVVRLFGRDIPRSRHQRDQLGRTIGIVQQDCRLLPHFSVRSNVAFSLDVHGAKHPASQARADACLAMVGLESHAHKLPDELSGGQRQRGAIAVALAANPRLVVLDEPTSALDDDTAGEVMDLLSELVRSHNVSMVLVSHDARALQHCHHVLWCDADHLHSVRPLPNRQAA